jgi:hypothetical protein
MTCKAHFSQTPREMGHPATMIYFLPLPGNGTCSTTVVRGLCFASFNVMN